MKITKDELHALLNYDRDSGVFTWRIRSASSIRANLVAGTTDDRGYTCITIRGVRYKAHRLAWLYVYGVEPSSELDHEDRNRSNNSIVNLRESTRSEQMRNTQRIPSGVVKVRNSWVAKIRHQGTRIYLGCFGLREEAEAAYATKRKELMSIAAR